MTNRNSSIENLVATYLELGEFSFHDFETSKDKNLGRVVTAKLSGTIKLKSAPRKRPTNAVRMTVDGDFTFLADHNWLPTKIRTVHRGFDKDKNEVRKTTNTFDAEYDQGKVRDAKKEQGSYLIPKSVTTSSKSEPTQRSSEITYTLKPLSQTEIKTSTKNKRSPILS